MIGKNSKQHAQPQPLETTSNKLETIWNNPKQRKTMLQKKGKHQKQSNTISKQLKTDEKKLKRP